MATRGTLTKTRTAATPKTTERRETRAPPCASRAPVRAIRFRWRIAWRRGDRGHKCDAATLYEAGLARLALVAADEET